MLALHCCKCLTKSCIAVKKDADVEQLLCLLHYHLLDDTQKEVGMRILDENEWAQQDTEVREKVTNAASDLVLQMMELQKEDQRKERIKSANDVLNNIGSSTAASSSSSSSSKKPSQMASILAAIEMKEKAKRNSNNSSSSSLPSDDPNLNPYNRKRGSVANSGLWMTGKNLPTMDEMLKEQEEDLEKERREAEESDSNVPCSSCGSKRTFTCGLMSYDIGKSEIWGSKDTNNQTLRIQCKECKFVTTVVADS